MRARRSLFATTVTALVVLLLTASTLTASAAGRGYERYVALGDSYTSGPLIPLPRLDPLGCARSTSNYPAMLAKALEVTRYTDVSCGGADTTNMTTAQTVPLGSNPPQFDALRPDTDLVTIGIGGNDYSVFGKLVGTCPGLRESDPTGSPCREHFTVDGVDTLKAALEDTRRNITAVLTEIHQRSPQATVLAIGYPRIGPESGFCPDILPFAEGDYAWLNSVEEALNDAVSDAAEASGSSYVDTYTPSLGHDACAGPGRAWINGKDTNVFAALSYHPFRLGMTGVADIVGDHLQSNAALR